MIGVSSFQSRVTNWMLHCFGVDITLDRRERNHRFLEEALELVQANGCTVDEAYSLVNYVFGRDKGERVQEVGGTMITLMALCTAIDVDAETAGDTELNRVWTKIDAIRAKQKIKPVFRPKP